MDDELSPLQQDEAASDEHHEAVARGEKRVLRTTSTGRLHSYPADEMGFTPGRGQAQVRTWWGMAVLAVVMALLALLAVVILVDPLRDGQGPEWSALFLLALGGSGTGTAWPWRVTSAAPLRCAGSEAPPSPAPEAAPVRSRCCRSSATRHLGILVAPALTPG